MGDLYKFVKIFSYSVIIISIVIKISIANKTEYII